MGLPLLAALFGCSGGSPELQAQRPSHQSTVGQTVSNGDIQCWPPPEVFPTFDKTCSADSDCDVGLNQIDCCGTLRAIGINVAERDRFDAAEAVCYEQYPPCGCAPRGVETEDDQVVYYPGDVGVACTRGACLTYALE
jgi:hypothetical protein